MRILCLTLGLLALMGTVLPAAMAQDPKSQAAPMSNAENDELAARAAQTPDLGNFKGGDDIAIYFTPLALIILIVVIILLI